MERNNGQGRTVYGGRPNGPAMDKGPAIVEKLPAHVMAAGPAVMMGWAMQHAGDVPLEGEVDETRFRLVEATRADAREMVDALRFEVIGGPQPGYRGGTLFDVLPDDSPAVAAAIVVVRCQRYEAQLQDMAPELSSATLRARTAAETQAYEQAAPAWEHYNQAEHAMRNDTRREEIDHDLLAALRPPRLEPDLTEVRRAQARLDMLGSEIRAVRRRGETAGRVAHTTLKQIADASAQLLWLGPAGDSYRPDWGPLDQARDILAELCGEAMADDMMDKAVKRWGTRQ